MKETEKLKIENKKAELNFEKPKSKVNSQFAMLREA
jgi:hypothetical protein